MTTTTGGDLGGDMTGDTNPGEALLDKRSVGFYNTGDARLVLSPEGELRMHTGDHSPLLCKFTERGIRVWDRAQKKERLIPWRVVDKIGTAVDSICLN